MPEMIEITNFEDPELDVYARLTENQLFHYYEPEQGLFIAESPKVIERALQAGYEPVSCLLDRTHITQEAQEVLARCGLTPGAVLPYRELEERVLQAILIPGRREEICGDCQWTALCRGKGETP